MPNSISHFSESVVGFVEHKEVTHKDITICYSVRCGEINPWVLTRIKTVFGYYEPMPNVMIVDFGSSSEYASTIKKICDENNAEYVYVDDSDTFSGNDSNLLIVFYVQIMPDDFVMQLHRF